MIIINNVNLPLETDFDNVTKIVSKELGVSIADIKSVNLYRKSVDARHKSDVHFCCSFIVETKCKEDSVLKKCKKAQIYNKKQYSFKKCNFKSHVSPVVVGFGPAGMFSALCLAEAGLNPIIIERGKDVDERTKDVNNFFSGKPLNENSNVQFGEGGAGTFSDGKLNTGIKDPRCRAVLECFVQFGAPKSILTDAKPHIGTDILKDVVKNLRNRIISLGGQIHFNSILSDIEINNNSVSAVVVNNRKILCEKLVIAIGHSARDTFEMIHNKNVEMQRKPFAVGVRIEHKQEDINRGFYGSFAENPSLQCADYKMAEHLDNGRGVYTFCMCPGGEVINASSENGGIAINGMSNSKRDGCNANSAILVGVNPEDIKGNDVLEGCYFQREIEQKAYRIAKGKVPITTVGEFVYNVKSDGERVIPTVKPEVVKTDITKIFPDFVNESLKEGLKRLGKKNSVFSDKSAIISAPETRSSSPVRILRNEKLESVSVTGLYPCGEGAGYAGGIMSAAVDGIRCAEAIIDYYC